MRRWWSSTRSDASTSRTHRSAEMEKHRAPAHQNSFAFKHNPNSKKTKKIAAMPIVGLCRRCHEILEWRKKYRKYKPLVKPGRCNDCHGLTVRAAYHHLCTDCSKKRGVCPKCMKPMDEYGACPLATAAPGGGELTVSAVRVVGLSAPFAPPGGCVWPVCATPSALDSPAGKDEKERDALREELELLQSTRGCLLYTSPSPRD